MLNKFTISRLCKISHIKAHNWLKNFTWDSLISLDMKPPYIPKFKNQDYESSMIPYVSYLKVI